MNDDAPLSVDRVPTLTEVVELGTSLQAPPDTGLASPAPAPADGPTAGQVMLEVPAPEAPMDDPVAPGPVYGHLPAEDLLQPAPLLLPEAPAGAFAAHALPPPPAIDEHALVGRVLAELSPRIDMLFQSRVREALAPALARAADHLIRESSDELASTLRALVEEAVTRALQRREDQ